MLTGGSYTEWCRRFRWRIPARFNIGVDICDKWTAERPRTALIHLDAAGRVQRYTFHALRALSNRLANTLKTHGIARGDRVGIMLGQQPETLISHIAVYKLGAVAVPLLTLFGPEAAAYRLGDSGARALITDGECLVRIMSVRERLPALQTVLVTDEPAGDTALGFWPSLERASETFRPAPTSPDDPAVIIYTSGTTGPPKGTLHGHRLLLGVLPGVEFYHNRFPRPGDVMYSPLDWAYIGGSYDALFPALHHGVPVVAFRPRKFDPERAFDVMARHRVTNLMAVPTVLRMMKNAVARPAERFRLHLRSVTAGGETLGEALYDWSREHLGVELNEQYGQTECDLVIGFCAAVMPIVRGAIGRPVPGHRVAVLGPDGRVAAPDETGEIAIRRPDPAMFLGYWNDPAATAARFTGDWMRTGDFGRQDATEHFWFTGRRDDLIESGGYRIGPGEIEACLMNHPAVVLVCVVGIPHAVRGQVVAAVVQPSDTARPDDLLAADLQAHVRRHLEAHAVPRRIRFVTRMPMTRTGKILKSELRRLLGESPGPLDAQRDGQPG